MSAEGKKKRGEAGKSNAASIPFRYHGRKPPRYNDTSIGASQHPCGAGSRLVNAMRLGICLPNFSASERLMRMTDEAMVRCGSKALGSK